MLVTGTVLTCIFLLILLKLLNFFWRKLNKERQGLLKLEREFREDGGRSSEHNLTDYEVAPSLPYMSDYEILNPAQVLIKGNFSYGVHFVNVINNVTCILI